LLICRKTTETCEEVSERPTDDGHEWRKYGQKTILNSKYSRCVYIFQINSSI